VGKEKRELVGERGKAVFLTWSVENEVEG